MKTPIRRMKKNLINFFSIPTGFGSQRYTRGILNGNCTISNALKFIKIIILKVHEGRIGTTQELNNEMDINN